MFSIININSHSILLANVISRKNWHRDINGENSVQNKQVQKDY